MLFRTRYNVLFRQFRLLTAQAGSIPAAIRLIFENCYNLLFCFVGTVSVIQLNFLFQHHAACHIANNVHAGSAHIA